MARRLTAGARKPRAGIRSGETRFGWLFIGPPS